jgi:spermidine synthase
VAKDFEHDEMNEIRDGAPSVNVLQRAARVSPALIYSFFFASGFAALLYQIVWLKYLNLLFGSTTYATAAVLAAFMCGLSIGSRIPSKFPRLFQTSLKTYGLVEIGIGVFAVTFPYLYTGFRIPFAWIFNLVGPQSSVYNILTFVIAFFVLLIPTAFMGATLPLLSHYLIPDSARLNRSGILYAINTAGAVCGILCSAFLFIPNLGLSATVHAGVLLNLLIGLICYFAGQQDASTVLVEIRHTETKREPLLYLYALSGLAAIGYEVLWTRLLVLHLGSSVYAYAIMLAVFLIGISMGSYISAKWTPATQNEALSRFSWIQIGLAFSILLQIVQFAFFRNTLISLGMLFGKITITIQFLILFLASVQLLILPTALSGALFPLVVTFLHRGGKSVENAIALSYSYNTLGGILGSIIVGFLLLPLFGTQVGLLILGGLGLSLGIMAWFLKTGFVGYRLRGILGFAGILSAFLLTAILLNKNISIIRSAGIFYDDGNTQLVHLEEETTATISVENRSYMGIPYRSLSVNGVNVAGTSPNLIAIQKMQAHIPLLTFGPSKNKRVLHVGFGSGGTAYAASLYPNTQITVVEISRGIVRNADAYFRSVNHGVAGAGNVRFIYFDGRSYLQNTSESYDVILSDSIHPRYSGNGSLYTKDYYQLVYQHLNPQGVHSQWIPIYSVASNNLQEILKAFSDVFDDCNVWYINSTVNPFIIVTGRKQGSGVSLKNLQEAFEIAPVSRDLKSIGMYDEYFLLDHFLFGNNGFKKYVGDAEPHIDDLVSVEYESSRIVNRDLSWWINFHNLLEFREPVFAYLSIAPGRTGRPRYDAETYEHFYDATSENLKGHLLMIERKIPEAKKAFAEAQSKNPSDREPFEYYHGL